MTSAVRGSGRGLGWIDPSPALILADLVLVAGIALRFLFLDADPHYYEWRGYIVDEGRWVTHARELVLFGRVLSTDWTIHLMLAPIYQAVSYLVFELFGVTIFASRLFTAICGSALLVMSWAFLRRVATPSALLLAMVVLAFDWDLLVLSRVGIPEVPVMAVHLVVYMLLMSDRLQRGKLILSGLIEGLAIGIKVTAFPVAAIWALVIAARRLRESDARTAIQSVAWYVAPLAVPAALGGVGAAVRYFDKLAGVLDNVAELSRFVVFSNVYGGVEFFFESRLAPSFALWALGVWLATLGRSTVGWAAPPSRETRYFDGALIWCLSYTALMQILEYFPSRYKIHSVVPMAICIGVGVGMLERAGVAALSAAASAHGRIARVLLAAWLALPAAVVLAPGLFYLGGLAGMDLVRLRVKIAAVACALSLLTCVTLWRAFETRLVRALLLAPVAAALASLALRATVGGTFWYGVEGSAIWHWPVAAGAAAVAAALAIPAFGPRTVIATGAVGYMILSLVRIAPGFLEPHYTIRDASVALGRLLSDSDHPIGALYTEGVFNENRLVYTSLHVRIPMKGPDTLVVSGKIRDLPDRVEREYETLATYPIYLAPEYREWAHDDDDVLVKVLRRRKVSR